MKIDSIPKKFVGISGPAEKKEELRQVSESLANLLGPLGYWQTDNLITFAKNFSFLDDVRFTDAVFRNANHEYDKAIIWRTHVLSWAAKNALRVGGDLVECGTHLGFSVAVLSEYLELQDSGRTYWCYDLFEGPAYARLNLGKYSPFEFVERRFRDKPFVRLIKGEVPESFGRGAPSRVCFLHLDMNSAPAERAALERLLPLMPRGAFVVLDDYGWIQFREQKVVADEIFGAAGIPIVELPTGQGLAIIG